MNETIEIIKTKFKNQLDKGQILKFQELIHNYTISPNLEFKIKTWYNEIIDQDYIPDFPPGLEEIFIHSPEELVFKTNSSQFLFESLLNEQDLQLSLEVIALKNKQSWNFKTPFISFTTKIKDVDVRVSLTHYSVSPLRKSKAFIRILNKKPINLDSYLNKDEKRFVKTLIKEKKNILIAGPTGSGKTTFTNSLLQIIPEDDHLIILEDTFELISPNSKTTRMLSESKNESKSINSYLSYAMRMSPDRIILGEIRSKEVESIILALNTGHNGLLSTVHANSAKDAITRLALLFKIYSNKDLSFELILKLICENIDYVFFLENKKIKEMINIIGSEKENIFYDNAI